MAEKTFEFSGPKGLAALGCVAVVLVLRIATLGETDDPKLEAAIRAELNNDLGNELGKTLDDVDPTSEEDLDAVLEQADAGNITLHSVKLSKPLLSFSTRTEAIVRVEYSLPGIERRTEYWRFDHGAVAGWRYRNNTHPVSYYLNFI